MNSKAMSRFFIFNFCESYFNKNYFHLLYSNSLWKLTQSEDMDIIIHHCFSTVLDEKDE